jgi:hypothetical protein
MAHTQEYVTLAGLRANSTGLATSQFLVGRLASTAGQAVIAGTINTTTNAANIYGVIMNKPGASEEVEFAVSGIVKAIAATSTIAIGDRVHTNTTGKLTDAGTTDNGYSIGRALTASGAANDIITVLLNGGGARF